MANALTKTNTTLSPNSISNKQASVEEMSTMKQVLLGNEQTQRAIVTADQQGNELGQNQQVQDALYMDPFEFAVKYGPRGNRERQRIRDAYSSLKADQRLDRSSGEAIGDSALSALNGLVQLGGFVPTLGAMGYDSIGKGAEYVADAILPEQLEYYTHRSGRTARAGKTGNSIAFILPRNAFIFLFQPSFIACVSAFLYFSSNASSSFCNSS